MEPMLLEDYKYNEIPQTIKNLVDFFQRSNIIPERNDIIVGFLYILMLESGFVDKDCTEIIKDCDFNYQRLLRYSESLPQQWKRGNLYHMDFVLQSCPQLTCSIICVPVSDDLQINCTVRNLASFSLLVDPLAYFISSKIRLDKHSFQNLQHLARNFKDTIAFPAKVKIISVYGGICACLHHLPPELIVKIMCYLEIDDVLHTAMTCYAMCEAAQDVSMWVKLLNKDFRKKFVTKSYGELKFLYEIKYSRVLNQILAGKVKS